MAKLNRRRNGSRALENRQMFAADIIYSAYVPLAEDGVNAFNETILGDMYDSRYDPESPNYRNYWSGLDSNPNLSGVVRNVVEVLANEDGTQFWVDRASDGYENINDPASFSTSTVAYTLNAGGVRTFTNLVAGDRILSTDQLSLTRFVEDSLFYNSRDSSAGITTVDPAVYSGTQFEVTLFAASLTDTIGRDLFTDAVGFISFAEDSELVFTNSFGTERQYGGSYTAGTQLFLTDADLQNLGGFTDGWASVTQVSTNGVGSFSLTIAAGNDALNTSYWFDLVPTENLGSHYLTSTAGASSASGVIYAIYNAGGDGVINLAGEGVDGDSVTLNSGNFHVVTDVVSAFEIIGDPTVAAEPMQLSVFAVRPGSSALYSGWGLTVPSLDYLGDEVFINDVSQTKFWIAPSTDTKILVEGAYNLVVREYLNGTSRSVELERVESSGKVWYQFDANYLSAYELTKSTGESVRVQSLDQSKLVASTVPSSTGDYRQFSTALTSTPKIEIYRDLLEDNSGADGDSFVELSETATVVLKIVNNTGADITIPATGVLRVQDSTALNAATATSNGAVGAEVSVNVYDSADNLVTSAGALQDLSVLNVDGLDLATLFGGAFIFEQGHRIELRYGVSVTPDVTQLLIDSDYALLGTTSLEYGNTLTDTLTVSRLTPLHIEVDEAPSLSIVGSSGYGTGSYRTNGAAITLNYYSGLENTGDVAVLLDFGADFAAQIDTDTTLITLNGYTLFAADTSLVAVGTDGLPVPTATSPDRYFNFTPSSIFGALELDYARTLAELDQGKFYFTYVKSGTYSDLDGFDLYNHSSTGSTITEPFVLDIRNDQHKQLSQNFEIRVRDLIPYNATSTITAGSFVESDFSSVVSGNIISASGVQVSEGVARVVSARYNSVPATGDRTVNGSYGRLTISADGAYSYQLYSLTERNSSLGLEAGVVAYDDFYIIFGDFDYSGSNGSSADTTNLRFRITGERDIDVSAETSLSLDLPENGVFDARQLEFVTNSGVRTLVVDLDGATDGIGAVGLRFSYSISQLNNLASSPVQIDTSYGVLTLTGFTEVTINGKRVGTLTFDYEPNNGAVPSNRVESIGFFVTDNKSETLAYDLNLNLIPAIAEDGLSIWTEDTNGAVAGDYTVVEQESSEGWNADNSDWKGITVHVEPAEYWRNIDVEGVLLVREARIFDDSDPENVFNSVGRTVTGLNGTLRFEGMNQSLGELYFSYVAINFPIDHSEGAVFDAFTVNAVDILNVPTSGGINILLGDTYPATEWDYFGSAESGVLTEDGTNNRIVGNVLTNDYPLFSRDLPNEVVGVKSLTVSGGGLFEFTSADETLLSQEDGGEGVVGRFGTLWMTPDGSFVYELDNERLATQALTEGMTIADEFAYTLADTDSHPLNNTASWQAARLYIYIDGAGDPKPEVSEGAGNFDFPISDNAILEDQQLVFGVNEGVETLVFGGQTLGVEELADLSPENPLIIETETAIYRLTGFNPNNAALIYDRVSKPATSAGITKECVPVTVTDRYGETSIVNICFDLAPPRLSDIRPITQTELLATDGSGSLVRTVYNQQVGLPSVQEPTIELTNPSEYFGGDFEQGPLVDDRRLSPLEPFVPEEYTLLVQRDIPPQLLSVESRVINYVVPSDTFLHTDRQARVSLSVTLLDGSPIPDWLEFDPNTATFSGIAPEEVSGEFQILIIARDNDGRQAETIMRLIVEEPNSQASVGRKSFSEELASRAFEERVDAG